MGLVYREASAIDLTKEHLTVLAIGFVGSGKTYLASTFPNPLFICTDAQILGLMGSTASFVEIATLEDIHAVLTDAQYGRGRFVPDKPPVETIVLDGLTECTELAISAVLGEKGKAQMSQQLWGFASDRVRGMMRQLVALRTKYHIVVTAKATVIKDDMLGGTFGVPDTIGKFQHVVPGMFHIVGFCEQTTVYDQSKGKMVPQFKVHTAAHNQFPCVDRTKKLDVIESNDYNKWAKKLYGGQSNV